jgi:hypothetical protein
MRRVEVLSPFFLMMLLLVERALDAMIQLTLQGL